MTCRELIDFLTAYREGELEPAVRAEFDRHLAHCGECRDYLDSYMRTVDLAKSCGCNDADAKPVPESLIKAILEARKAGGGA